MPGVTFTMSCQPGLRSIRYYRFCHSAPKANQLRVPPYSRRGVESGAPIPVAAMTKILPLFPGRQEPMPLLLTLASPYPSARAPQNRSPCAGGGATSASRLRKFQRVYISRRVSTFGDAGLSDFRSGPPASSSFSRIIR